MRVLITLLCLQFVVLASGALAAKRPISRIYQIEEIKWFKKYIDGEDWQPWVRATSAL